MSSTDGSPTYTCWNRRSSAASFSMYLRYSSSVVAPIRRSSPRASIGLIMLPASTAPSAPPAPTIVCSSSMNVMISPSESAISLRTALNRSSNSPRYFAPATIEPMSSATTRLLRRPFGHVALDDAAGQALDDRGLADAGLADEHGVVLRAARQHLDDAPDLLVAADDRIDLALARRLGEIAAVLLERLVLLLGVVARHPVRAAHLLAARRARRRAYTPTPRRRSPTPPGTFGHREQDVLGRQVLVVELAALLVGFLEEPERVGRELRVADRRAADASAALAELLVDVAAQRREVDADPLDARR